jgi:NADH-quinone oxidoreductase subunit M
VTKDENKTLKDLNWREIVTLVPLLVFIFWIGLYPKFFFDLMSPSVEQLVNIILKAAGAQ